MGEGDEEERLAALAGPRVRLLGERHDVPELLRAFDVFVLCSRNEGISNTILEAMASGLPVIASNVGGTPELVEHERTGSLFPAGDAEALASLLAKYRADSGLREAQARNGRRRALEQFSIAAMVRAYEEVWSRVAG